MSETYDGRILLS